MKSAPLSLLAIVLGLACLFGTPAVAETPKCISIRLVVPRSVGSATDMIMRAYAETINQRGWGQLINVVGVN